MNPTSIDAATVGLQMLERSMAKPPVHEAERPVFPAAEWGEDEEGTRCLTAPSGDGHVRLDPPAPGKLGFLDCSDGQHSGVFLTEAGAAAAFAVLSRYFHEPREPEAVKEEAPPEFIPDIDRRIMALALVSMHTATYRGSVYHFSSQRHGWVREGAR